MTEVPYISDQKHQTTDPESRKFTVIDVAQLSKLYLIRIRKFTGSLPPDLEKS